MDKFLIVIPIRSSKGGITEYYNIFERYATKSIQFSFFERGNRRYPNKSYLRYLLYLIIDYIRFFSYLLFKKRIVIINISLLSKVSLIRDSIFLLIGRMLGNKVIVFYHGWEDSFVKRTMKGMWFKLLLKADSAIVIRKEVKKTLIESGYKGKIFHTSTMVDDKLVCNIKIEDLLKKRRSRNDIRLLFLSRIEINKGIYEVLEAFKHLQKEVSNIEVSIAGNGRELEKVQKYVANNGIRNVTILGFVHGPSKERAFSDSDIYLFPSYTEGMPTSLLEAMAFGLPVITTKVGAVPDFFQEENHGYYVPIKESNQIVEKVKLLLNEKLRDEISRNNFDFAKKHFLASSVSKRNEQMFKEIMEI